MLLRRGERERGERGDREERERRERGERRERRESREKNLLFKPVIMANSVLKLFKSRQAFAISKNLET